MKVKELIEKLKEFDPELAVVVQDGSYCSDWCNVEDVSEGEKGSVRLDGYDLYIPPKPPSLKLGEIPEGWGLAVLNREHERLVCDKCRERLRPRQEYIYRYSPNKILHNSEECYGTGFIG